MRVKCKMPDGTMEEGECTSVMRAPPRYTTIITYNVKLDCKKDDPGYTTTPIPASCITEL